MGKYAHGAPRGVQWLHAYGHCSRDGGPLRYHGAVQGGLRAPLGFNSSEEAMRENSLDELSPYAVGASALGTSLPETLAGPLDGGSHDPN